MRERCGKISWVTVAEQAASLSQESSSKEFGAACEQYRENGLSCWESCNSLFRKLRSSLSSSTQHSPVARNSSLKPKISNRRHNNNRCHSSNSPLAFFCSKLHLCWERKITSSPYSSTKNKPSSCSRAAVVKETSMAS